MKAKTDLTATVIAPERPATISMQEAAAILGVNVKTLYAEASAGHFPVLRIGRTMRVSRAALEAILERGSLRAEDFSDAQHRA
jgi:excisionase family DNA binding protein